MEGIDLRNEPGHARPQYDDPRWRPNEGLIFYDEKLMADPSADPTRRMLSHDGGQASPRNEHY
jgi:hypothetical protein